MLVGALGHRGCGAGPEGWRLMEGMGVRQGMRADVSAADSIGTSALRELVLYQELYAQFALEGLRRVGERRSRCVWVPDVSTGSRGHHNEKWLRRGGFWVCDDRIFSSLFHFC